jgi:hypothetical protein
MTEPNPKFQRVPTPWTDQQVTNANAWQTVRSVHPFTCGQRDDHAGQGVLVAATDGWHCPECDYTQEWAYAIQLNEVPTQTFRTSSQTAFEVSP